MTSNRKTISTLKKTCDILEQKYTGSLKSAIFIYAFLLEDLFSYCLNLEIKQIFKFDIFQISKIYYKNQTFEKFLNFQYFLKK